MLKSRIERDLMIQEQATELAILGFGKAKPAPLKNKSTRDQIDDSASIDFSILGIKPDKVNFQIRLDLIQLLKELNKRGRLFNVKRITNVDSDTVCAVAQIRETPSLAALEKDLVTCGFENIAFGLHNTSKRPVIVYGENANYKVSVDTYMNVVTLRIK